MSFSKDIIRKYNIRLSKKLGQNFITDNRILDSIISTAQIEKDDLILEIGAGAGTMTREIAKHAGFVVAVEIDRLLIPALKDVLSDCKNVEIINEDAMKINFSEMIRGMLTKYNLRRAKVVANLPYYITTPIIMKFLEEEDAFESHLFMVQKEVAERMVSKPSKKVYGALSVAVQYYSTPTIEFVVPPSSFVPEPAVYSAVVKLIVNQEPPSKVLDQALFFKVVKASFAQRRKTLLNALSNFFGICLTKQQITDTLKDTGVSTNQRGETLGIEQFAEIANRFTKIMK